MVVGALGELGSLALSHVEEDLKIKPELVTTQLQRMEEQIV